VSPEGFPGNNLGPAPSRILGTVTRSWAVFNLEIGLRSIWLQARPNTAPQFCGLEIVNASLPLAAWHSKRRAHTESHYARTPPERVTGRVGGVGSLQTIENRDRLSEPVLGVLVSI
jgi:hypothetical protein